MAPTTVETPPDDASPRAYARIVGLSYLAITLCGALGVSLLDARLRVEGDHAATAANILAHGMAFRLGMVSVVIIYASVLVASWALYVLLKRVDRRLALLALLFRTAEGIVGLVTILTSLAIVRLLQSDGAAAALDDTTIAAWVGVLVALRASALDIVLCLIGVGGTIFMLLFWRSRLTPRWLSMWGVLTYLSMLGLAFAGIVYIDHPRGIESALYGLGAAFEGVFAVWLLWRGVDVARLRTHGA